MDTSRFISDRAKGIDASGIRRVMDLGATLKDPINLSIGQPDFDVPDTIKAAACDAINQGNNHYTQTQGTPGLRAAVTARLAQEFPKTIGRGGTEQLDSGTGLLITSGVSGGLVLSLLATVGPGDEVVIPDPYFVMYKHLVTLAGATPVYVDTYPDFAVTAERIESALTERTKLVLFNTPSNPTGVVATQPICKEVVELCERRGVLLVSDEIYDEFCYEKTEVDGGTWCPSPLHASPNVLLLRGYSKTYGMTGWRLGYAAGPAPIIEQMTKIQQYSFVCAPSMVQAAGALALGVDMSQHVSAYQRKRDRVVERLSPHHNLTTPGGAFYAFPEVPPSMGLSATQFVEKAIEKNLLIIPGSVFSQRDTHFRLSYACDDAMLERGLDVLVELASG
ncbi:MAG: aminotransferase class I/II-fold pyridoxal phosphate-dependent enzyme [Phycisphaeraceae bacterium]|nr:aminotransferase class I/II-fold pyridoxal phosphate-dependent enzyme [Phycisphaeraceae bacterium]